MAQNYYQELMENGVPDTIPQDGFTFEDLFDEHVASHQKTWAHDRRLTVGASEAFGCMRKTWFSKNDKPKDPGHTESWGAMRRGDILENHFVVPVLTEGLARRGMDLIMAGEEQYTLIEGQSSATLDGLITGCPRDLLVAYGIEDIGADCVTVEIKSFDPRISLHEEKGIHRGQVQMQMGILREKGEFRPNFAVLVYVNASWLDDIRIFVVPFDQRVYEAGKRRAEMVFETTDPAKLMAEGKLSGMCDYCPYVMECARVSTGRVPPSQKAFGKKAREQQDPELIADLDAAVRSVVVLKREQKRIKSELEHANELVRQRMTKAGQSRAYGNGWGVTYTAMPGKKTISAAIMRDYGLEPEDFMTEGAGYEKLTVTGGDGDDGEE